MKIYINKVKENWIVDRFISEWKEYSPNITRNYFSSKSIIWIIAPWTWGRIPKFILKRRKVVCTIHHIDEDKLNKNLLNEFMKRDLYVDMYHAISKNTQMQLNKLTKKQVKVIPFWVNKNIWFEIEDKYPLYEKYDLAKGPYYIGSFQRDTEGHDLLSPKLSKGPDQFVEIVTKLDKKIPNLEIVLAGNRRQFVINELKKRNIKYHYFEMVNFEQLNELYNLLNLYIVSSRYEGGPQAIMECALTKTPIISTDVGIAKEILHPSSIFKFENFSNAKPNIEYAFEKVQEYLMPDWFSQFDKMFDELNED